MGTRPVGRFDVIIVNYHAYLGLQVALESVYQWDSGLVEKVIVVDNECSTTMLDQVRGRFPNATFLPQSKNIGFSKAVNLALDQVGSEFVMLLNPDAHLKGPIFAGALAIFREHHDAAVLGPRVLDADGKVQGSARWHPTPLTALFGRTGPLTRLFPKSRYVRRDVVLDAPQDELRRVDWVSGACMLVRMSAVKDVGPLDERFFLYWEDCDWCRRFRDCGWRIYYAPVLGDVIHECGQSSKRRPLRSLYHFHRSAFLLYLKYDDSPFKLGSALVFMGSMIRFLVMSAFFRRNSKE